MKNPNDLKNSKKNDITPDDLRHPEPLVVDQRQQRIDPTNEHTVDPNERPDSNRKQPGGKSERVSDEYDE
jgi:predicted alpha/beta superfamily hydrolase